MNKIKFILLTCFGILLSSMLAKSQDFQANYTYDLNGNRIFATVVYLTTTQMSDSLSLNQVFPGNEIVKPDTSGLPQIGWQPGTKESLGSLEIIIYPNPTHGKIIIEITGATDQQLVMSGNSIIIWDIQGRQTICSANLTNTNVVDLSQKANGTYLVKVSINGQVKEYKIIKE